LEMGRYACAPDTGRPCTLRSGARYCRSPLRSSVHRLILAGCARRCEGAVVASGRCENGWGWDVRTASTTLLQVPSLSPSMHGKYKLGPPDLLGRTMPRSFRCHALIYGLFHPSAFRFFISSSVPKIKIAACRKRPRFKDSPDAQPANHTGRRSQINFLTLYFYYNILHTQNGTHSPKYFPFPSCRYPNIYRSPP